MGHDRRPDDAALAAVYRVAVYRVDAVPDSFVLRVGERSPSLAALHATHAVTCSAFLTACNPMSVLQPDARNRLAQARLERELDAHGYVRYPGAGLDPAGTWPDEASVLVLGLPRPAAMSLGRAYGQNAILWCGADAVPELVLLTRR